MFRKSDVYLVGLLWKMICDLGDPMSLRQPVHTYTFYSTLHTPPFQTPSISNTPVLFHIIPTSPFKTGVFAMKWFISNGRVYKVKL